MKRVINLLILGCVFSIYCFSQTPNNITITVEITNVVVNNGKVYLALFADAESFRKEKPLLAFELNPDKPNLVQEVVLPSGEYVVSAFQDANNNMKLDYGLFGIPKELVGISNYSGKGIPTKNFDKQKIMINNSAEKVIIGLYKF